MYFSSSDPAARPIHIDGQDGLDVPSLGLQGLQRSDWIRIVHDVIFIHVFHVFWDIILLLSPLVTTVVMCVLSWPYICPVICCLCEVISELVNCQWGKKLVSISISAMSCWRISVKLYVVLFSNSFINFS